MLQKRQLRGMYVRVRAVAALLRVFLSRLCPRSGVERSSMPLQIRAPVISIGHLDLIADIRGGAVFSIKNP